MEMKQAASPRFLPSAFLIPQRTQRIRRTFLGTSALGGSRKFPRFDDTFRAKRLHRLLQSVMTVCASSTESNASTESTSSRTREQNDSTNGFCHGEPGSMKLRPAAL